MRRTTRVSAVILLWALVSVAQEALPDRIDGSTPPDVQMRFIREAGPEDVVENATIYILRDRGYERLRTGTNGFSCLILREQVDTLEPECYDAEGSSTTLQVDLFLEQERAKGREDEAIRSDITRGYRSGRFRAPRKAGILYMLSPHNRVYDPETRQVISFPGHLMFYAPYATEKTIGKSRGAPYIVHPGGPDALLIVVPKQPPSAEAQMDQGMAQIKVATREFVEGFNSGDVDRMMRLYADRYVDINLKNQVQTREERAAYYKRIIDRRNTEVEVTPEEIIVDGNHALARGTVLLFKVDGEGKRGEARELRYLEIWEKQPAGWKSIWGIDAEIYPESR